MNLESDKRLNIQLRLDFSSAPTGEARQAGREDIESLSVVSEPERPANMCRIMEEVCERESLKEALRRARSNKGSAGVDGMTVDKLGDYLKQHWPVIREQLLNGIYEPKPVRRVEIQKPDGGGGAKAWHPNRAGPLCPASGDAGSAEAMESDVLPIQLWVPTASVGASRRGSSAAVHCARQRMGGRPRSGKILRSSQSRQTDGPSRQARRGQAAVEAHPGIPQCRGDGERTGQFERG